MRHISPLVAGVSVAALLGICAAAPAGAQSKTPDGGWQFELTPYLWLTGIRGDAKIAGAPQVNFDVDATEVLNHLDFGAMGSYEARNGRWGLFFDAVYAKLSASGGAVRSPLGGPGITVNADVDVTNTIFMGAAEYRAIEGRTPVDLFLGGRYYNIDIDTTVTANFFGLLNVTRSPSYSKNWWDPYIGARVTHPLTDRWTLVGYADYGGFQGGNNSWQAVLGAKYDFSKTFSGNFGYRYLHIDYDKDNFALNVDYQGVYVGLGIKF